MSQLVIKFETTGNYRSGTAAKSGKPYFMCEAFAHLPGVPYPQKFTYYAASQQEVLQAGTYEGDIQGRIKDDRLELFIEPSQARRVSAPVSAVQQKTA